MMDNCQLVMYCLSRGGIAIPNTYHNGGSNYLTVFDWQHDVELTLDNNQPPDTLDCYGLAHRWSVNQRYVNETSMQVLLHPRTGGRLFYSCAERFCELRELGPQP